MVGRLAQQRVDEIAATEGAYRSRQVSRSALEPSSCSDALRRTSYQGWALARRRVDTDGVADVAEDLGVPEAEQTQLAPVRVCREILERVEESPEESVCLVVGGFSSAIAGATSKVDALQDPFANKARRGVPVSVLVRNVVLHARVRVDLKLDVLNRGPQTRVDPARISSWLVGLYRSAPRQFNEIDADAVQSLDQLTA